MKNRTKILIIGGISLFVIAAIILGIIFLPKQKGKIGQMISDMDIFAGETALDDGDISDDNVFADGQSSSSKDKGEKGKNGASENSTETEAVRNHTHKYGTSWSSSKPTHWHECSICKDRKDEADHVFSDGNDKSCNVCGYIRTMAKEALKHKTNSSGYDYTQTVETHSDAEANLIKAKVYAEKNTEDIYPISGKKYYISKNVSPKETISKLKAGDAILFERGGIWRIPYKDCITIPKGVTLGAYGKGEKPKFYGSRRNYADNALWQKVSGEKNLYKTYLQSSGNVGNMVFNDIACLGVKKFSLSEVKSNYDFYYAPDENLYFYYDGDIEKDFNSIEISQRGELINFNSNCVIDNICVKYTGSHGIDGAHNTSNVTITNCEVGFIGGSLQSGTTRFGNGIEFPIGAQNITVKNNHIYQCYDAGFTWQTWSSAKKDSNYYDIEFSENLVENCCYCIEYFTTDGSSGSGSYSNYKNISIHDNVLRFAGYEWSQKQRPDPWMTSLIRGGQWAYVKNCENFTITNNIFDITRASIIFWWWNDPGKYNHPEAHSGLTVRNNTFYQAKTPDGRLMNFHNRNPIYGSTYDAFKNAVELFDPNPKKIVWLENLVLK